MTTTSLIIICRVLLEASLRPASSRPSSMSAWSGGPGRTSVGRCRSRSRSAEFSVALVGRDGGARLAHPLRVTSAEASCRQPGEAVSRPRLASIPKVIVSPDDIDPTDIRQPVWAFATRRHPSQGNAVSTRSRHRSSPTVAAKRLLSLGGRPQLPAPRRMGRLAEGAKLVPPRLSPAVRSSSVCSRSGRPTASPESTRSGASATCCGGQALHGR